MEARPEARPAKDQIRLMMQSLLAERFKLSAFTWKPRQLPPYAPDLLDPNPARAGPATQTLHPRRRTLHHHAAPGRATNSRERDPICPGAGSSSFRIVTPALLHMRMMDFSMDADRRSVAPPLGAQSTWRPGPSIPIVESGPASPENSISTSTSCALPKPAASPIPIPMPSLQSPAHPSPKP